MSTEANELLEKALVLSTHDRGAIASYLIESLDEGEVDLDAEEAWQHEVARRLDEIRSGKAEPIPEIEVKLRVSKMLREGKIDDQRPPG